MRKCLPFLIIDANSPIDCKLHKRCPRFEWIPFCPEHTQCKPYEGFKMYIAGEMWQNLNFCCWKECMITEQWKRVMLHNQNHQIVHSSAMYCQNFIIIHVCSKKLLKMKNSKTKCITPIVYNVHDNKSVLVCIAMLFISYHKESVSKPNKRRIMKVNIVIRWFFCFLVELLSIYM